MKKFSISKVSGFVISEVREIIQGATKVTSFPITAAQTVYGLYNAR